jgi:hypothetical protein
MNPKLTQGAYRVIRATNVVDSSRQPMVVTGWAVRAAARRHHAEGELLAEWSSDPDDGWGTAVAEGREVRLIVTPAMSSAWGDVDRVHIQAEITNPLDATQVERIINQTYDIDREAVI